MARVSMPTFGSSVAMAHEYSGPPGRAQRSSLHAALAAVRPVEYPAILKEAHPKVARIRTQYRCTNCDRIEPKWLGLCPACGEWNTYTQVQADRTPKARGANEMPRAAIPAAAVVQKQHARTASGIAEIDRVLGGGLVPGCVVLIGGEPGIGKSTLLLQVCAALASEEHPALYVTGEESAGQVRERAERLGLPLSGLHLLADTDVDNASQAMGTKAWSLVVVDSVQTLRCPDLPSAPGGVTQVRESAARLAEQAKRRDLPLFLIGHVTKEGTLAGPRTLEHLVDTVLYFEADPGRDLRVIRAHKNRHGPVSEIGVFEMTGRGLTQVGNPSAAFLADRPEGSAGSVVFAALRGSRPILVEVQALVSPTPVAQPRRTAWGCDPNRVALLAAVLERRAGAQLAGCDLFLNVAGGLSLDEPAADLAICTAILSSLFDRPVPKGLVVFGEVGLAGEIRAVPAAEARMNEAERLGFDRLLMPSGNAEHLSPVGGCAPIALASLEDLAERALEGS